MHCGFVIAPFLFSFILFHHPLWSRKIKNLDMDNWPLALLFARSLALPTHSLAPHCSLCSRPLLRLLVRLLAHFAHSLARGKVNYQMAILSVFLSIPEYSAIFFLFFLFFLIYHPLWARIEKKNRINSHLINQSLSHEQSCEQTSERSGARERSEQCGASE